MVERAESDYAAPKPIKGEKQYRDFLLQSLGVTSLLIALVICFFASLPTALAEELAFTPEEVADFAGPGARLLAKSKIPENVKTGLVNSGDYIGLGTAAIAYVYRILGTMREVREHGSTSTNQVVPTASSNGHASGHGSTATIGASHLASWGNFAAG